MKTLHPIAAALLCLAATVPFSSAVLAQQPAAAAAQTSTEHFEATLQGVRTVLTLRREGTRLSGQFTESGLVLPLTGQAQGTRLSGRVEGPAGTGLSFPFEADHRGDALHLRIALLPGQPAVTLAFQRVGTAAASAAPAAPAAGAIEPALVGRWVRESVLNSPGGAGGFASFATVRTLALGPDGRARQTVRSAGGGGSWSHSSGEETEFSGRWQVRGQELWVQPDGQPQFVAAGRYALIDGRLVVTTARGRQIWTR
jgi:hypothetical protein